MPARVAVFASGGGTNLQSLIDRFHWDPAAAARVELVVGSRAGIGALGRAAAAGIPVAVPRPAGGDSAGAATDLLRLLEAHAVDMVVLAGYLQLVPEAVVERYRGRMLNIHPALLPAFGGRGMYGMRVHQAVLSAGCRVSGATVHLVDERYDEGAIVAQWPVPVLPDDTPERLAARVLAVEHVLLPAAVAALARGAVAAAPAGPLSFDLTGTDAPSSGSVQRLTG